MLYNPTINGIEMWRFGGVQLLEMSRQAQGRSQASKVYNEERFSRIDLPRSVACTEEEKPLGRVVG